MKIIYLLYDDIFNPKDILGFIIKDELGNVEFFKLKDLYDTPYYNFPLVDKKELKKQLANPLCFVHNKKTLIKFFNGNKKLNHIKDLNTHLWSLGLPIILDKPKEKYRPLNQLFQSFYDLDFDHTISFSDIENEASNIVLEASNLLDGILTLKNGDRSLETKFKWFDYYTKTGRLHDVSSNSINIKKERRWDIVPSVEQGILVLIDFDGFHIRIMDNKLGINKISKKEKAHEYLRKKSNSELGLPSFKKEVFHCLYSGNFSLIDYSWFKQVEKNINKLDFVLPIRHQEDSYNRFNTIIQQHEVLELSKMILNLKKEFKENIAFELYLYDGVMISINKNHLDNFIEYLNKNTTDYPLTLETKTFNSFIKGK